MRLARLACGFMTVITAGIFFLPGCTRDPVIAKVNGEPITQNDLKIMLRHKGVAGEPKTDGGEDPHKAVREQALEQLINERLMIQEAGRKNLKAGKDEIKKAYEDMLKAFPKEEDYLKKLKEKGLSKRFVMKAIEKELLMGKFRDSLSEGVVISEAELHDFYGKNSDRYRSPERLRLLIIKAGTIEEAKSLKKEIEQGARFEELAVKHPAGHAEKGGETGWITLDTFPQDIAREIKKIKAGSFGGPIRGREGYYIIMVQERKEAGVKPFDEVKEDISKALRDRYRTERFHEWLQNARKGAKVEMLKKS